MFNYINEGQLTSRAETDEGVGVPLDQVHSTLDGQPPQDVPDEVEWCDGRQVPLQGVEDEQLPVL